ncbi:MAG TPA: PAS domain-containing protein [Candidatus Methylacidiphilales bacterium]
MLGLLHMETSDQSSAEENNSSPLAGEEFRMPDKQLQEQAAQLRALNQELVDREQRLRLSIEVGRVGVWVWDTSGSVHTLEWSQRLKQIFGLPPDAEVTREIFLNCVHPEDRERVDWAIMQSLAGVSDGFYNIEYRIIHASDSSLHWVSAQGQAFFDASGQSIRFIGAVVDISDRKQVEEFTARLNLELENRIADRTEDLERTNQALKAEVRERTDLEGRLRQSEAYLAEAQRLSQVGSFSLTLPAGILTWSDETIRISGYEPGTSPTIERALARVHPEDVPRVQAIHEQAYRERAPMDFTHRLLMPDQSIKYVRVVARPTRGVGDSVEFVGAVVDITRQKVAEDALRASERLARGQLDTLKEILNSISTDLKPDKFLQHVLGLIAKQLGGQSVSVFSRNYDDDTLTLEASFDEKGLHVPEESTPHTTQDQPLWAEAMRTGTECLLTEFDRDPIWFKFVNMPASEGVPRLNAETLPFIVDLHKRLQSQGVILSLAIPMVTSGKVSGFLGIRFTKRREFPPEEIDLSRALAHQAALAMQLMRLSRESQQTAVIAERNRLARDIHDTLAQGFTGVIAQLQAAKGATDLADASAHIERAENLARSSLGEARRSVRALRPRSLQETTLCTALENMLKTVGHDSGLKAEFVFEGEQRPIPADWEEGLLRVVQESLTNAIKHAQAGKFRATLSFEAQWIRLKLEDDGRGFNPAEEHEGFGLIGMKERVGQMGGQFVIHTQPGHGTETIITLPCPAPSNSTDE